MMFKLCMVGMLVVFAGSVASQTASRRKTHIITIHRMEFVPATMEANAGDVIIWKNEDMVPHTATSEEKVFDSHEIKPGTSYTYVAHKKGSHSYICRYHPTMKAVLVIR